MFAHTKNENRLPLQNTGFARNGIICSGVIPVWFMRELVGGLRRETPVGKGKENSVIFKNDS